MRPNKIIPNIVVPRNIIGKIENGIVNIYFFLYINLHFLSFTRNGSH